MFGWQSSQDFKLVVKSASVVPGVAAATYLNVTYILHTIPPTKTEKSNQGLELHCTTSRDDRTWCSEFGSCNHQLENFAIGTWN